MNNWHKWIESEERPRRSRKPNKNKFCRKNRNNGVYGPHVYEEGGKYCIQCGHLKKKSKNLLIKETENDENSGND